MISRHWNVNQAGLSVAVEQQRIYEYGFTTVLDERFAVADSRRMANYPAAIRQVTRKRGI
jgi:hypothetical protein